MAGGGRPGSAERGQERSERRNEGGNAFQIQDVREKGSGESGGEKYRIQDRRAETGENRTEASPYSAVIADSPEARKMNPSEKTAASGRETAGETEIPKAEDRPAETRREAASPETGEEKAEFRETEERAEAMKEISLREYSREELEETSRENERQIFRNGNGETMTYAEAHREMVQSVSDSLDALEREGRAVSPERRAEILRDVNDTLLAQQAESHSRGIGNHGIPHLYGVYERMKDTPEEVLQLGAEQLKERRPESRATPEDMRLAMTLAAVYHDQGYLAEQARRGVNAGADDSLHGVDSAIAFENRHLQHFEGIADGAVLDEVTLAMAEHNALEGKHAERVRDADPPQPYRMEMLSRMDLERGAEMDPNEGLIRSALLLSDKAAVDADEKVPDVLRREDTAAIVTRYYTMKENGAFSPEEADQVSREMRERMKTTILQDGTVSEAEKKRLTEAVDKDFSVASGKFNLPLSGAATSRDALRFRTGTDEKGNPVILADVTLEHRLNDDLYVESFTGLPKEGEPDPDAKKLRGAMEDYGIIRKGEEGRVSMTEVAEGEVRLDTSGAEGLGHVTVTLRDVTLESEKAEITEFQKTVEKTVEEVKEVHSFQTMTVQHSEKTWEELRESSEEGETSEGKILELCAAVYMVRPEEAADIAGEVEALRPLPDSPEKQEKLQRIARKSLEVLPPVSMQELYERGKKEGGGR